MKTLLAYFQLARPLNGVIAFISAWLGGIFASGRPFDIITDVKLVYVSVATLLLLSAGNSINDYCDYKIDQINKPNRPLPSGRIRRRNALFFAAVLIVLGIGLGALINWEAVFIAILVSILLISYAVMLKGTPFVGNLVVGSLTSLTFISGGVAIGSVQGTYIPAIFAFLFTTSREIVKDLEDTEGDKKDNLKTLAVLNPKLAVIITLILMLTLILFSPIPFLLNIYTWHYFLAIIIGVDLVLIFLGIQLYKDYSRTSCALIQRWLKWDIFVGLCAIFLGIYFQR